MFFRPDTARFIQSRKRFNASLKQKAQEQLRQMRRSLVNAQVFLAEAKTTEDVQFHQERIQKLEEEIKNFKAQNKDK